MLVLVVLLVELEVVGFIKLIAWGLGGLLLMLLLFEVVLLRLVLLVEFIDFTLGVRCMGRFKLLLVFGLTGNFLTVLVEVALFRELLELTMEFLELDF